METLLNSPAFYWLVAAVVLAVVELGTSGLVCIWFALGAVAAMIFSLFVESAAIQWAVFLIVSALLLVLTRSLVKKKLLVPKEKTNWDRLIGESGTVLTEIGGEVTGQVRVKGQVWSAQSEKGESILEGAKVTICAVEGAHLVVRLSEKE